MPTVIERHRAPHDRIARRAKQDTSEVHPAEVIDMIFLRRRKAPRRRERRRRLTRTPVSVGKRDRRRVFQPVWFPNKLLRWAVPSRIRGAVRSSCFFSSDAAMRSHSAHDYHNVCLADLSRARRQDVEVIGPMAFQKLPASRHWRKRNSRDGFSSIPFSPAVIGCSSSAWHRPVRQVVDLLALDAKGGLVIIEGEESAVEPGTAIDRRWSTCRSTTRPRWRN